VHTLLSKAIFLRSIRLFYGSFPASGNLLVNSFIEKYPFFIFNSVEYSFCKSDFFFQSM